MKPGPRKRVLELSCGVRSLQQVPWWNADRRAPLRVFLEDEEDSEGGAEEGKMRLPAFRFPCAGRPARSMRCKSSAVKE